MQNSVFYLPCQSRLASGIHPYNFFKLLRISSHQNVYWILSDLYIPTCVGKIFQFMVFTFLENHWIYAFLLMSQSLAHKLLVAFFENLFPQDRRSGLVCSSIKIESEYMKMTWNISFFPFGRITIFLNVMALQFCNVYQIVWY